MAEEIVGKEKFSEYVKNRYKDQVEWYNEKSVYYKRLANILQFFIILPATVVPIAATLEYRWATIILSTIVAVNTGLLKYFKFEDLWHNYRTTCEMLKKEKYMYNFKIGEYKNTDEPQKLFVERVESLVSREHTKWTEVIKKNKDNKRV